jgi:hypothetical protein
MAMDVYFSTLTQRHEYLLPGITNAAEAALWFPCYEDGPLAEDIVLLTQLLDGLRPVVSLTMGDHFHNQPIEIRDIKRAFGYLDYPTENLVIQTTVQYQDSDDKVYSDVAWWASDASPEGRAYIYDFVSFIPDTKEAVRNWTNIFYGINWLKICQYWNFRNPTPPI